MLERSRAIRQPEGHHKVFKQTISRPERGLPFVSLGDAKAIECGYDIQFGVVLSFTQPIQSLSDQWDRVSVLYRERIEGPIVHTES